MRPFLPLAIGLLLLPPGASAGPEPTPLGGDFEGWSYRTSHPVPGALAFELLDAGGALRWRASFPEPGEAEFRRGEPGGPWPRPPRLVVRWSEACGEPRRLFVDTTTLGLLRAHRLEGYTPLAPLPGALPPPRPEGYPTPRPFTIRDRCVEPANPGVDGELFEEGHIHPGDQGPPSGASLLRGNLRWAAGRFELRRWVHPDATSTSRGYLLIDHQARTYRTAYAFMDGSVFEGFGRIHRDGRLVLRPTPGDPEGLRSPGRFRLDLARGLVPLGG